MKRYFKIAISLLACLPAATAANADVAEDARALIDGADYQAAAEILEAEIKASPRSSQLGTLNALLGECRFELGDYKGARECFNAAKAKGVADAYRFLGRLAYLDYDLDGAAENYSRYRQMKTRAKKPTAPEADEEEARIGMARDFLERVEKVAIIDSITTDFNDFYKTYRLPASAGRLVGAEAIPFDYGRAQASMAYANEAGDYMVWAEPDTIGAQRIYDSIKLTDGSWHQPTLVGAGLLEGDSDYPFMMADGLTLYFANSGPQSMGGYDIFVASRDAATGEYMQPQNMGMPYNSPYDDFMMAIDEQNGVGWWATDRKRLDGKVTVYVFAVNDLRSNYNSEEDDVVALARIDNIAATQQGKDFSDLRAALAEISTDTEVKEADFHFPMKGGKVYTSLSDFKSPEAREAMQLYLEAKKKFDADSEALAQLRREYAAAPSRAMVLEISRAEKALETDMGRLRRLRSDVYRAEKE